MGRKSRLDRVGRNLAAAKSRGGKRSIKDIDKLSQNLRVMAGAQAKRQSDEPDLDGISKAV